jgi:hypothetical protein
MSIFSDLSGWELAVDWLLAGVVLFWSVSRERRIRTLRKMNRTLWEDVNLSDDLADSYRRLAAEYQKQADYWMKQAGHGRNES